MVCSIAGGAEPDSVGAPYIEVGDCWSYRSPNLYNHGPVRDYELCVNIVDRSRDVVLATATVKEDGREIDVSYTLDGGLIAGIAGTIARPPARFLRFPLRVGDRYSVDFEYRSSLSSLLQGTRSYQVQVVGWEEIVVPAGKFRALKVVAQGISRPPASDLRLQITETWWYVPDVARHVKYSQQTSLNALSEELTDYRLNK